MIPASLKVLDANASDVPLSVTTSIDFGIDVTSPKPGFPRNLDTRTVPVMDSTSTIARNLDTRTTFSIQ